MLSEPMRVEIAGNPRQSRVSANRYRDLAESLRDLDVTWLPGCE